MYIGLGYEIISSSISSKNSFKKYITVRVLFAGSAKINYQIDDGVYGPLTSDVKMNLCMLGITV